MEKPKSSTHDANDLERGKVSLSEGNQDRSAQKTALEHSSEGELQGQVRKAVSKADIYFIRHSKSGYKTYAITEQSQNPRAAFDPEHQVTPDLTEEGVKFAKEKADEFFQGLDPAKDKLFFVSSNEARAFETANVYREIAHARGFEVIKPDTSGGALVEQIGGGEIKTIENLSLNPKDTLVFNIFIPEKLLRPINWSAVDGEFKEKWETAREIIKNDDQGSYGANLHKHSEAIKKIFPEVKTTQELHDKQFKNLLRLAKWAEKKFKMKENKIKVVAFGHENYILQALDEYLQERGINNCETIGLSLSGDNSEISYRGKKAEINLQQNEE